MVSYARMVCSDSVIRMCTSPNHRSDALDCVREIWSQGRWRPPKDSERYFGLIRVTEVNGVDPDVARYRPRFEDFTPVFPDKLINVETKSTSLSTRLIDVLAPIGRGQRGLIVSPPKAGKTMLLKDIASGVTLNHPDMHLMVALVGERPEEVTDVTRSVEGEVFSSTFDEPVEDHCRIAELALERSKRLAEGGTDVVCWWTASPV